MLIHGTWESWFLDDFKSREAQNPRWYWRVRIVQIVLADTSKCICDSYSVASSLIFLIGAYTCIWKVANRGPARRFCVYTLKMSLRVIDILKIIKSQDLISKTSLMGLYRSRELFVLVPRTQTLAYIISWVWALSMRAPKFPQIATVCYLRI